MSWKKPFERFYSPSGTKTFIRDVSTPQIDPPQEQEEKPIEKPKKVTKAKTTKKKKNV